MESITVTTEDISTSTLKSTSASSSDHITTTSSNKLPVFGLEEGWVFDLVHGTALACLSLGIICSCATLVFLFKSKVIRQFYHWTIGERLVVYMAVFHLFHNISHVLDHSYMLIVRDHPPDGACASFGFILNSITCSLAFMVLFTAVNAFMMVVKAKKMPVGPKDCGLLLYSLGIPLVAWLVGAVTGHTGPSGTWCSIDLRKPLGPLLYNIISILLVGTFFISVLCYIGVWLKLRKASRNLSGNPSVKYSRSTRTMLLFMAVFMAQWWALVLFSVWVWVTGQAPLTVIVLTVIFANLGGVFNMIVHIIIQKKKKQVEASSNVT